MSTPIIRVKNLHKTFSIHLKGHGFWAGFSSLWKPRHKKVEAVRSISFEVEEGEIVAFIGPNGAGKSTTIKMLTGILYPTSGNISVLGIDPSKERQKLAFSIGSVFGQKPQLWYHLPAIDTYRLFAKIYEQDPKAFQERLDFLVDKFEIRDLLETPVRKLSLGQRMRCEIVASLLHRPKIIFLDEPTIGLDVIAKQKIREVIKFLNETEKVTIFLTSHDAGDIEALAQRSIVINHGTLIFDGTTEELKRNYIKTKVIEVVTETPVTHAEFSGTTILEQDEYRLKLELNTHQASIESLLSHLVKHLSIKDITISDPSMEEIIAGIYQSQK
jgi:ABC-2 type transport system ATP-binding protein